MDRTLWGLMIGGALALVCPFVAAGEGLPDHAAVVWTEVEPKGAAGSDWRADHRSYLRSGELEGVRHVRLNAPFDRGLGVVSWARYKNVVLESSAGHRMSVPVNMFFSEEGHLLLAATDLGHEAAPYKSTKSAADAVARGGWVIEEAPAGTQSSVEDVLVHVWKHYGARLDRCAQVSMRPCLAWSPFPKREVNGELFSVQQEPVLAWLIQIEGAVFPSSTGYWSGGVVLLHDGDFTQSRIRYY